MLSLSQLQNLYAVADYCGRDWSAFGKLLILTGQRTSDVMRFCPTILNGAELEDINTVLAHGDAAAIGFIQRTHVGYGYQRIKPHLLDGVPE